MEESSDLRFDSVSLSDEPDVDQKEALSEVMRENTLLKQQFQQACDLAAQMEPLQKANQELTQKLRQETSKQEEATSRVKLLLQANQDLTKQIEELKKQSHETKANTNNEYAQKIDAMKKQYEDEIRLTKDQLQKANDLILQNETESKLTMSTITKILESAKHYFTLEFQNLPDFLTFLDSNREEPKPQVVPEVTAPKQLSLLQDAEYQKQITALKKKMKKQREALQLLVDDNDRIRNMMGSKDDKIRELTAQLRNIQKDVMEKNSALEQSFIIKENNYRNTISTLQQKIDSLKFELQTLRLQKPKEVVKIECESKPIIDTQLDSHDDDAVKLMQDQYMSRIDELSKQNDQQRSKREEIFQNFRSSQAKVLELESQLRSMTKKAEEMENLYNQAIADLQNYKSQYQIAEDKDAKIEDINLKNKALKQNAQYLQTQINEHQDKIKAGEVHAKELECVIAEKEKVIERLNGDIAKNQTEMNNLRKSLEDLQSEFAKHKQVKEEVEIPSTIYQSLPAELIPKCDAIMQNKLLQIPSKMQNVIKIIQAYYEDFTRESLKDNEEKLADNAKLFDSISTFITDLSISTTENPITLDELFVDENAENIINCINCLKKQINEANIVNEALASQLDKFKDTLGFTDGDVTQMIEGVKQAFDNTTQEMQHKSQKYKELKRTYLLQQKEHVDKINEMKLDNDQVLKEKAELEKELHDEKEAKKQLNIECKTLQNKVKLLENTLEDEKLNKQNLEKELEKSTKEMQEEAQKVFEAQINQLSQTVETLSNRLNKSKENEDRLQKVVKNTTDKLDEREKFIKQMQMDFAKENDKQQKKFEGEKKNMEDVYNNTMGKMRKQLEDSRKDQESLSQQLEDNNFVIKKLQSKLDKALNRCQKYEAKLTTAAEELHRDRLLFETAKKSQIVQFENKLSSAIDQEREKSDKEMRHFCTFAIDLFREYFKPTDMVDEKTARNILAMVSKDYHRMGETEKTIKSFLAVKDGQTIEDAISQLVLDSTLKRL
ncbi:hypothetical protein TVAG_257660 [Trichomonas vaginalis G3]|uniref:Uncharacterized protein n=1 Tax=Trichomonas vaginalis (strain ATCC PRA-98 / G3) TaxID=412133 RepID=A2F4E7_TRIV3|nr:biological adhesion protein [Trichomonas vaginalis G3]EAY00212.1 hypothetical protein TVAG_257660 [Trichomonas vaginalis G3]KAI5492898.1 biological adhesion protein [Trichomonas vaginalis G3]|eukprot:XP_001313141.1 hypothetical protein [Trichomonas vaginalis G3]